MSMDECPMCQSNKDVTTTDDMNFVCVCGFAWMRLHGTVEWSESQKETISKLPDISEMRGRNE